MKKTTFLLISVFILAMVFSACSNSAAVQELVSDDEPIQEIVNDLSEQRSTTTEEPTSESIEELISKVPTDGTNNLVLEGRRTDEEESAGGYIPAEVPASEVYTAYKSTINGLREEGKEYDYMYLLIADNISNMVEIYEEGRLADMDEEIFSTATLLLFDSTSVSLDEAGKGAIELSKFVTDDGNYGRTVLEYFDSLPSVEKYEGNFDNRNIEFSISNIDLFTEEIGASPVVMGNVFAMLSMYGMVGFSGEDVLFRQADY